MKHVVTPIRPEGMTAAHPDEAATAQDQEAEFAGFTVNQVLAILDKITCDAGLIAEICRTEAQREGESESANSFHAIARMVTVMGAIADAPTGGRNVGSFTDWMLGPNFNCASAT
jgi:hypothetical protein